MRVFFDPLQRQMAGGREGKAKLGQKRPGKKKRVPVEEDKLEDFIHRSKKREPGSQGFSFFCSSSIRSGTIFR